MSKSEQLFEKAQKVIPGGVNSPVRAFKGVGGTPVFIEKAEGAYITDSDGNLRSDYTTDGLHPDYYGKKYIGEQIGHYLLNHFMWLTQNIK